jgi:hypothetical protein
MSQSPPASPQSVNTGAALGAALPKSYPHTSKITLVLELEVQSKEQEDSLYDETGELTIPFIGDLFDQLSSMYGLPIQSINGKSFKDVQKYFEHAL